MSFPGQRSRVPYPVMRGMYVRETTREPRGGSVGAESILETFPNSRARLSRLSRASHRSAPLRARARHSTVSPDVREEGQETVTTLVDALV
jgi:hypothetical protein